MYEGEALRASRRIYVFYIKKLRLVYGGVPGIFPGIVRV